MHTQPKSDRPATERVHAQLHLRLSGAALAGIKAAAAARGEDVTAFVLRACPVAAPHDLCKHGGGSAYYCYFVRAKVRCVKAKEV